MDAVNSIFGDEAPSRSSVCRWYGEFNRDHSSHQGEFREGRPKSVIVPETIDAVRQLLLQDRYVTYREIEHLTAKKICSHWIPDNLSIA